MRRCAEGRGLCAPRGAGVKEGSRALSKVRRTLVDTELTHAGKPAHDETVIGGSPAGSSRPQNAAGKLTGGRRVG